MKKNYIIKRYVTKYMKMYF